MKGFLSKFLRNKKGGQKPYVPSRREPTFVVGQRNNLQEIQEDLHPDATFIDYEVLNNDGLLNEPLRDGEQTSEVQASSHLETVTSEHDHFDEDFQDEIEQDSHQPHQDNDHDPFEPPYGFISEWMKAAQENTVLRSLSIQTTFDTAGNAFIHYAAGFGNTHLLKQLIEDGWPLNKPNYSGKTPYDFAVQYENKINTYFIENILNDLQRNSDGSDKAEISLRKENVPEPLHNNTQGILNNQARQYDAIPADDISEAFNENLETEQNDQINDLRTQESKALKTPNSPACIKCDGSFADFNTAIKLGFCPYCGAEQLDDDALTANTASQPEYAGEEACFYDGPPDDYQFNTPEKMFLEQEAYTPTAEVHINERVSEDNKQTQRSKSSPISSSEEPFNGVDEGFDYEILDIDLQSYQPASRGRNSSDEDDQPLRDWSGARSESVQTEEWEIFLDEDLEEQSHPSDQYFEDEDPLEQGKIVEYASRLTSRITSYQSKDRRRIYAFFISILGDFPFYQSYAAIERLIVKDVQIDQIRDAYAVKLLWMTNPNIWSSRRYNRMENNWSVSRNPKLKNSMSWQFALDLVNSLTPNELENLILNDWYAEWLNLPLHGGDTASGLDPAYSLYPTYLYEKRRLLTANVNTW